MKRVIITGASRGIGKALAQKFLKEGYGVIGTSIDGTLDYSHDNLVVVQLDLLDSQSILKSSSIICNIEQGIDILINNAGALFDKGEGDIVIDELRKTLEINLIGPIDFTQRVLGKINNGGHIVNISSTAGSLGSIQHTNYPSYKISKAGLNMFTTYLAFILKDRVKVSSVHPGSVKTEMGAWVGDMSPEEAAEQIYNTAVDKEIETGQFWFKGEKFPW
jgi:NAD(P)-dependent dehydrogenase (short-subunit alcohol dehydrogenase family)